MNEISFNLIDERWIPCITHDGRSVDLSLMEVFRHAHELRELYDRSPLVTASITRFLLCILHRVFGPEDEEAWFDLWQRDRWDMAPLEDYLNRWHDRFDLFHPDPAKRFYQAMPEERFEPKSIMHLVHSRGNNPALFNHETEESTEGLTFAQAAQALITAHAFRSGGLLRPGDSSADSPSARGITFLLEGENFFETLMLNLFDYPNDDVIRGGVDDRPAWEMDDPFAQGRRELRQGGTTYVIPYGYLDYLSWQSLRIWLIPPEKGDRLTMMRLGLGHPKLQWDVLDPMKHHRAMKTSPTNLAGYTPQRFSEDRSLWRDSSAILRSRVATADRPPYCFKWLSQLIQKDYKDLLTKKEMGRFASLGMASDQAKIEFYRHDRYPLPLSYLEDTDLVDWLSRALEMTEKVAGDVGWATREIAQMVIASEADLKGGHQPHKDDISHLTAHWDVMRFYWGALEPKFWELVVKLPQEGEIAVHDWIQQLRRTAWDTLSEAEAMAGDTAGALKAAVKGRRTLAWALKKTLAEWEVEGQEDVS